MSARLHHLFMLLVVFLLDGMHPTEHEQHRAWIQRPTPRALPACVAAFATVTVCVLFAAQLVYGWSL